MERENVLLGNSELSGNLERLKDYFNDRIDTVVEHENADNTSNTGTKQPNKRS